MSKNIEGSERHLSRDWPNSLGEIDCVDATSSVPQLWALSVVSVATFRGYNLLQLKESVLSGRNGSRSGERRGEGRKSRSVSSEDE